MVSSECHLSTEFWKNWLTSFCTILLTNKLTNKQTNANEFITFLVQVTKLSVLTAIFQVCLSRYQNVSIPNFFIGTKGNGSGEW